MPRCAESANSRCLFAVTAAVRTNGTKNALRRAAVGSLLLCLTLLSSMAWAHGDPGLQAGVQGWNLNPQLLALLGFAILLYGLGLLRLWRQAGWGRGAKRWQVMCYVTGLLFVAVALISPLDGMASELSSAHMLQHVILIVVAAPLLVLALPLPVFLWALPSSVRRRLPVLKQAWINTLWPLLTMPFVAWALHAIALWVWHAPVLYQAALRDPLVHDLEHASFFVTALLFWWAVFRSGGERAAPGIPIALLFTTVMHSGVLGALMTFAVVPWYPAYGQASLHWGITPLEDQQLAGLLMWVPAGFVYLIAALGILAKWLSRLERIRLQV